MPASDESRRRLAELQGRLIESLRPGGSIERGPAPERLRATAEALLRKRRRGVRKTWPDLCQALGADFAPEFDRFAATTGPPREGGPLADGRAFADDLRARRGFPAAAWPERFAHDLRFRAIDGGFTPRRGTIVRVAGFGGPPRIVLAIRHRSGAESWFWLQFDRFRPALGWRIDQ